jgi:SAM-dependent methyltransferase
MEFQGRRVNQHIIGRCECCGMVQAIALEGAEESRYSAYGDYLVLSGRGVERRVACVGRQMASRFRLLRREFVNPVVLDFGSGAGYFCRAAQERGFDVRGVEISEKLGQFCKETVHFYEVVSTIEQAGPKCDAIFLSDVIEHFSPVTSRTIMVTVVDQLKPGGLLIGNTPNIRSANILLHEDADPVIAPPSHLCYFSLVTLDMYLSSLGLQRVALYSSGLSSNSFCRPSKFGRSFMEKALRETRCWLLPLVVALRVAFAGAGYCLRWFGLGYQLCFVYRKPAVCSVVYKASEKRFP